MNREEKREDLFYHISGAKLIFNAKTKKSSNYNEFEEAIYRYLDQAYQYGLQCGKKEAVDRYLQIQGDEEYRYDFYKIIDTRKKEMLGPLSTPKQDE